jgi:hypothetical protein
MTNTLTPHNGKSDEFVLDHHGVSCVIGGSRKSSR